MIFSILFQRDSYTVPESYVINQIYEYDISKANINILYEKGVIDDNLYDTLYNSDKKSREVYVGIMQKNGDIARTLSDGFRDFRHMLFESNKIADSEVISIKKDAVFVTRPLTNTKFGKVEFKLKNVYNLMIKLNTLEIYFGIDSITREFIIDIKGIKDEKLDKYNNYLFNIFISIFSLIINHQFTQALRLLNMYIKDYIDLRLDITTYRELNTIYMYKIQNSQYYSECVLPEHVGSIDISYNLNLLLNLKMLIINMYYN